MSKAILVSACLLGLNTRYSGQTKYNPRVVEFLHQHGYLPIPVCPEQLAGLPTPRPATEFTVGDGHSVLNGKGQLTTQTGDDVSSQLCNGAKETLKIAALTGCTIAILKERSPSCGVHWIYRQGELQSGSGVAAALLQQQQIRVLSEEDLGEELSFE
jgi:uncharacterized protein YbbK (DUF523 family)